MKLRLFLTTTLIATLAFGQTAASTRTPKQEAEYAGKISARADDIIAALSLKDTKIIDEVKDALLTQYRGLDSWQHENEFRVSTLRKQEQSRDLSARTSASEELRRLLAARRELRQTFLARLEAVLTPEQVEVVKDKMTYNKVKFTFDGYCNQYPSMTEAHRIRVLAWLKEAREEALDGGSAKEKSDIFNKYKGRINNYLSREGVLEINKKRKKP